MRPDHNRTPHHTRLLPGPLILLWVVITLVLASCQQETTPAATVTPTITETPQPTRLPTLTPTPYPPGSPENPYVIGVVAENNGSQASLALTEVANRLANYTGKAVTSQLFPDYLALIRALENGEVHISWLPPITYLHASQRGLANAALITSHFGVYQYGAQYMANIDSGFTPYFDPISGYNSTDAKSALVQFQGMRPCWVESQSTAGYIVPAGLLVAQAVDVLQPVFTQTHTAVVRALYIKGICDFGATFSTSGDPRTSSAILDDLPDAMQRVTIIFRTDPIIPNLNISLTPRLNDREREELINGFLDINRADDGKLLLSTAAGGYQIEDLRVIQDALYDPLRQMVDALKIDPADLIGK